MKFSCFNLRFSSRPNKQTVREGNLTIMKDPEGGGKEELGEEE